MLARPSWEVTLDDGTILKQGRDCHYTKLFTEYTGRVAEFRLVSLATGLCGKCNAPVIPPRVLIRVRLDKSKRLIYRKRPPIPGLAIKNDGRKPATVWVVGWQQTLHHFTDLRGNPANVQQVAVFNEDTTEVFFLDRFAEDIGAGTHEPELYGCEIEGGIKAVLDSEGKMRPEAGALQLEEEKNSDVVGLIPVDIKGLLLPPA